MHFGLFQYGEVLSSWYDGFFSMWPGVIALRFELVCAKKSDIKAINELMAYSKAYWGYDADFMTKFMQLFAMTSQSFDKSITKLLFQHEKPMQQPNLVGFYSFSGTSDNLLELDNFFIHPAFIGQGIGRQMWGYVLESIHKLGQTEFTLWSDPNADAFYLKMGCEKVGIRQSPLSPMRNPTIYRYVLKKNVDDACSITVESQER